MLLDLPIPYGSLPYRAHVMEYSFSGDEELLDVVHATLDVVRTSRYIQRNPPHEQTLRYAGWVWAQPRMALSAGSMPSRRPRSTRRSHLVTRPATNCSRRGTRLTREMEMLPTRGITPSRPSRRLIDVVASDHSGSARDRSVANAWAARYRRNQNTNRNNTSSTAMTRAIMAIVRVFTGPPIDGAIAC
jgi:hypothetical protein